MASPTRYKLVYTVLNSHLEATKDAIFAAKGGIYADGKYINVCFEVLGKGQFIPVASAGANPHTGTVDVLEKVEETRVEIMCTGEEVTRNCVAALKKAHPFEEVAYEVYKMEDF
ncbi:hypothetical protein BGZ60DRAFT_468685 [Tricladium varicosporioides]|nr:hypothetical protein BGZ60DRAFT_468685 [Hymenoscyphus varicosporioides]